MDKDTQKENGSDDQSQDGTGNFHTPRFQKSQEEPKPAAPREQGPAEG